VRREWPCKGWTSKDFDKITAAHFSPKAQDHADIGLITTGYAVLLQAQWFSLSNPAKSAFRQQKGILRIVQHAVRRFRRSIFYRAVMRRRWAVRP
jgi:hypothetical protein